TDAISFSTSRYRNTSAALARPASVHLLDQKARSRAVGCCQCALPAARRCQEIKRAADRVVATWRIYRCSVSANRHTAVHGKAKGQPREVGLLHESGAG